jgi:predicted DNA-binding transcriptional regulator AlpA
VSKPKQREAIIADEPRLDASVLSPQWLTLVRTANYLGLSTMTITRYATDEGYAHLNFPRPSVLVDRCYWNRDDLDAWMRSRIGAVSTRKSKTKSRSAA